MLTDVLIEDCVLSGLCAKACRIKCTNLEVTGCGFSGILSTYKSTILLKGIGTSVHHNCNRVKMKRNRIRRGDV